jgi:hypothetical protein
MNKKLSRETIDGIRQVPSRFVLEFDMAQSPTT